MHAAQTDASSVPAVGACIDGQMRCLASVLGVCLARDLVHVGTTLCTVTGSQTQSAFNLCSCLFHVIKAGQASQAASH